MTVSWPFAIILKTLQKLPTALQLYVKQPVRNEIDDDVAFSSENALLRNSTKDLSGLGSRDGLAPRTQREIKLVTSG
jgi:hypothetical protein